MNARTKQINEALTGQASGKLTTEETQLLENLSLTAEDVKKHGGMITVNADDQMMLLCESICSKLGIAPEKYVNIRLSKHDAQL